MKLTKEQAKQVLAFFGQQAAEDAPDSEQGQPDWDTHAWQTLYAASLAIGRRITEHDWHVVLTSFMDLQSFDRDPFGYLNMRGHDLTDGSKNYQHELLEDLVSWAIDLAYHNSGA